jgi:hypothetical protein
MNKLILMALVFGMATAGCETKETVREVTQTRIVYPATSGTAGGSGGALTLYVKEANLDIHGEAFSQVFTLDAGKGGVGGAGEVTPDGVEGPAGVEGLLEVVDYPQYSFDGTGITADMAIDIDTESRLTVTDNADPLPVLRVALFRVAAGQTLEIDGDVRIQAETFAIERGGRLVLRERGGRDSAIRVGGVNESRPGGHGAHVLLQAREVRLGGLIDLAGASGSAGVPGGNGGKLLVMAEQLTIEDGAQVLANGGDGVDGADEHE